MLNRNINSIIYQSYIKLGDLAYDIAIRSQEGWTSTTKQNKDWLQLINLDNLLYTVEESVVVKDSQVYSVLGASESQLNRMLDCIEQISDIHDYPVHPWALGRNGCGLGIQVGSGAQGPPGTNGV